MQANVINLQGSVLRTIDLDDRVFGIQPNAAVVHQAVVTQQANARQGTHDTRTRGEVAGGGKKPYRQKGTGYARQGSRRAPHYRGGGIIFGPHPRSYEKALPRKMRHLAMRSVLSARAAEDALLVVDRFELEAGKTKAMLSTLASLGAPEGAVVVLGERNDPVWRAARNLARVHVVTPNGLNLLDILRLPRLVLTESAVAELTRTLTRDLPLAQPEAPSQAPRGGTAEGLTSSAPESPQRQPAAPRPTALSGGSQGSGAPLIAEPPERQPATPAPLTGGGSQGGSAPLASESPERQGTQGVPQDALGARQPAAEQPPATPEEPTP